MELTTLRKFIFSDSSEILEINIPEIAKPEYGMYTWPCSPVLAQFIWHNRRWVKNKVVLELSAGTALPGIVAAKCGATVHFSDCPEMPECLRNVKRSCDANNLRDNIVHGITWGRIDGVVTKLPKLDVIISSDCFYNPKDFENLITTVAYLLDINSNVQFICSYQERSSSWSIQHLLHKWKLNASVIPLSSFQGNSSDMTCSYLPGNPSISVLK
ncbi:histone-arginine methyltransferase METTL23-like [Mya arenaria]|uniref:histone-arginine methyltransferase METTL23-like n=1 Tax=Mya arenaria TaxID=6604 RepID=UPI0022E2C879|nr:histone-arginine methyltransferase METTL23-like [Mya arenaria]